MKTNHFPVTIEDNYELLALMVQDAKKAEGIYKPGPYWSKKTKSAVNDIKKDLKLSKKSKITILLSPAAASFDQFNNFESRGFYFKNLIEKNFKQRLNV